MLELKFVTFFFVFRRLELLLRDVYCVVRTLKLNYVTFVVLSEHSTRTTRSLLCCEDTGAELRDICCVVRTLELNYATFIVMSERWR